MSGQDNVSTFPALTNQAVDKLGQEEASFSGGLKGQAIHKAVVEYYLILNPIHQIE